MNNINNDLISRQAAIDDGLCKTCSTKGCMFQSGIKRDKCDFYTSGSEPAIPLSWIEGQIKWLKSMDNAFATLSAGQISAMVNKWKDEQDG